MLQTPKQVTRAWIGCSTAHQAAAYTGGEPNSIAATGPIPPSAPRWRWPFPTSTNWAVSTRLMVLYDLINRRR
ncbi:MAG: hypothetical protein R2851_25440 [Caldilineaceae bacterium]